MGLKTGIFFFFQNDRFVCRDIGGSDPERMAAPRVEEYIAELFGGSTAVNVSKHWVLINWQCVEIQI